MKVRAIAKGVCGEDVLMSYKMEKLKSEGK